MQNLLKIPHYRLQVTSVHATDQKKKAIDETSWRIMTMAKLLGTQNETYEEFSYGQSLLDSSDRLVLARVHAPANRV